MWRIISGIFMGWSLGANDAANIFGIGVTSRIIRFRNAAFLLSFFVTLGAVLEGPKCMGSLQKLGAIGLNQAFIVTFSAASAMTILTVLRIPASTSQAIVGAIIGATLIASHPNWSQLLTMVICWVFTPVGGAVIGYLMYRLFDVIVSKRRQSTRTMQQFLKWTMIISGCFGSYALGANNVANTTGVYVNTGLFSPRMGALIGALSISLGAATYSRQVMETVGNRITLIGPQGAVIATLAHSLTIYIYTHIGIPVSSSQAIVGAVMGIGMVRGIRAVNRRVIHQIVIGWICTPLLAGMTAFCGVYLMQFARPAAFSLKAAAKILSMFLSSV